MPCLNSDGQLTEAARQILSAMERPASLEQVAAGTGLPLYRIRSAVRELVEAGLAAERDGMFHVTDTGMAAIGKVAGAA